MRPRMLLLVCVALVASCATPGQRHAGAIAPGARYVAMGSSFAAGPGVATSADQPPDRCTRSTDNYARLLARKLDLQVKDVSCSGATTAHLLGPWGELPPQVDALTADTKLVTVTIGGNDVGYVGTLGAASCRMFAVPPPGMAAWPCTAPTIAPDAWTKLDTAMRGVVAEVRRRSPAARLIFVDYLTILPERGTCATVPLTPAQADASRETARRLAALTARVAAETGSEVLKASALSRRHGPCGAEPWVTGFPLPGDPAFIPYHPNARGMSAVADALAQRLGTPNGG